MFAKVGRKMLFTPGYSRWDKLNSVSRFPSKSGKAEDPYDCIETVDAHERRFLDGAIETTGDRHHIDFPHKDLDWK
jgi:hypothetical protein